MCVDKIKIDSSNSFSSVDSGWLSRGRTRKRAATEREKKVNMGHTKLHSAATQGSIDDTIVELRQGADPNARDLSGNTPLHWAARRGHAEVARILVRKHFPHR